MSSKVSMPSFACFTTSKSTPYLSCKNCNGLSTELCSFSVQTTCPLFMKPSMARLRACVHPPVKIVISPFTCLKTFSRTFSISMAVLIASRCPLRPGLAVKKVRASSIAFCTCLGFIRVEAELSKYIIYFNPFSKILKFF